MDQSSEVATTGSDEAQQRPPRPPDRLTDLGYKPLKYLDKPLETLNARQTLIIEYMAHGTSHALIAKRIGAEIGQPLTLVQAADLVGVRRRNARRLAQTPIFQRALAKAAAELRSGEHLASIQRIIAIRDTPGQGKAADRKVQLAAAQAVLGEEAKGPSVNVNITNSIQTAGYVIDTSPERMTIEGEAK